MLPSEYFGLSLEHEVVPPGQVLLTRQTVSPWVNFIDSGRVVLGLLDEQAMSHQLGLIEGPFWLEASSAILGLPEVVDAMTESPVVLRRVPLPVFQRALATLDDTAGKLLRDVARAQRQQTELAVSRLAMDAEARCARWLLNHAEHASQGMMNVLLNQRKRLIAAELGIAPETLSRVLRHLRERSLIAGSGRNLTLLDPSGLQSLAGG
ncbi:MAG: Crp/Fnr family transcriptional regulator [Curvibacter sp.]|nr:Crp/Fnr family transcriptional regulator [Curvibacter sp.]